MPESTEALLISIVRRPREIFALVSERDAAKAEEPRPYAIKSKPLDRTSRTLYPRKDKLQESWRRLAKVTASDEETLYDLLIVAIESAPDLSIVHSPPPFPSEWAAPAARVKPTSAHPRAFQGTKHQPPKGARLVPFDARPYLCDVASLRKLLTPLAKFYPKVRARLKRCGYSTNTLDGIEGELQLVPQTQGAERRKCWTMPARFVQHIWPQVRWRAPRDVSAHVSLYGALELEKDERLLASVSRLIAASESGHACAWCGLAIALPIHRRLAFIEVLLELRPDTNPPKAAVQGQLEKVNALSSDEQFSMWVRPFLETLRDGASAEYLIAGFRLAAQFCPRYPFGGERNCDNFPEQIVEEIGIELAHVESDSWLPLTLWTLCGRFPGMDVVIRNSAWRSFTPDAAYRYFRLFAQLAYRDIPVTPLLWYALRKHIANIEAVIKNTPTTYQSKVICHLTDWLVWCDEPERLNALAPQAFILIRRLSAPPFRTTAGAGSALGSLLEMKSAAAVHRFLNAPDRSFEAIERACRRDNEARLIAYGLEALVLHLEIFTLEAFCTAPKRLMRTARALGGVSSPVRAEICQGSHSHPLFALDPLSTPLRDACSQIVAACGNRYENPIPARLKSWRRGEIQLSDGSLERYQRIVAEKLLLTRLDLIEKSLLERLRLGLPALTMTQDGQHALRLLGTAQENRRGLRTFLDAYWSGDRDYLSKHSETLVWYRKHPAISKDLWEGGIPFHSTRGDLTIQIERDPLEILKLGTYTGTCLAVGGLCSYSAVAVLLDINKQVLYARDLRGRVIARQLLAIADDDRLVCFSIYPLSSSPSVKTVFRDYDRAFAQALGIPVYEPTGIANQEYQISSVLAIAWWDDGSWDFNTTG